VRPWPKSPNSAIRASQEDGEAGQAGRQGVGKSAAAKPPIGSPRKAPAGARDIDHLHQTRSDTRREKKSGQNIGYRYDVNLVPDYNRSPLPQEYLEVMGWSDLTGSRECTWAMRKAKRGVHRNVNAGSVPGV